MSDPIAGVAKLASRGGATPIELLERNAPGYSLFKKFFATWLKVDITLLASILTVLGITTNALLSLRGVMHKAYYWLYKFFTASISIPGSDRLNREVLNWVSANVLSSGGPLVLTANTEAIQSDAWSYRRARRSTGRDDVNHQKRVPINYLPTFGTTWFFWRRRLFLVKRMPGSSGSALYSNMPAEYADAPEGDEPLVVMCVGRSLDPIKGFLEQCRQFADEQRSAHITVRVARSHWDTTILRPMRTFDTVHFDEDVKESLIQDIDTYLDPRTRRFYNSRGIPYRRGYLLHGPPGTGKTSLSLAIASRFKLDLYLLHLPGVREDSDMERLFASLPPQCVVLLEDIDAVGVRRKRELDDSDDEDADGDDGNKPHESVSRCTLSGLLNVLDGVASQEGRIVLMTSNHADKLDPALIRPGRIDKIIYLGNLSQRSAELMFLRMYAPDPNAPPLVGTEMVSDEKLGELALEFSKNIPENTFTPAQVQGYLLGHRHTPTEAVCQAAEWAASAKKSMDEAAAKSKKAAVRRARKSKQHVVVLSESMPHRFPRGGRAPASEADNESSTARAASESDTPQQTEADEKHETQLEKETPTAPEKDIKKDDVADVAKAEIGA